ncbi:Nn.00g084340.m01.CDS01 [Neocucurbitaria sp. VM-36]
MSGLGHYRDPSSTPKDLNEILARYSSPPLSSSPPMPMRRLSNFASQRVESNNDATLIPSSPLPSPSSEFWPSSSPQHRRSSTHSGYLSRDQLFGRSPTPDLYSSPLPQSKAMERIMSRRHSSSLASKGVFSSSPRANMQHEPSRDQQDLQSIQTLRNEQTMSLSTPSPRSSRFGSRASTISLRERFSGSPQDHWMDAGSFCEETANERFQTGSMPKFTVTPNFGTGQATPPIQPARATSLDDGGTRHISPAEMALRKALKNVEEPTKLAATRKLSWGGGILKRRHSKGPSPNISQTTVSGKSSLGSSHPVPKIPGHFQARSDDHEAVEFREGEWHRSRQAQEHDSSTLDGSYIQLQRADDSDTSSSAFDPQNSLSLSIVTTFDYTPLLPARRLTCTAPKTILSQAPTVPLHKLTMSPIQSTISRSPIPTWTRQALSFSDANAIIYSCVSFAAIIFVVRNIDNDIDAVDIAYDMSFAFMVGVVLCVLLHWRELFLDCVF